MGIHVGKSQKHKRDSRFYFADGNITILVEDVLFKVHRGILTQDSSIFTTTHFLPPLELTSDDLKGSSDESPFTIRRKAADEFRILLQVLYALPYEIMDISLPTTDIDLIVKIASVTHEYGFAQTEDWAARLLLSRVKTYTYPKHYDFLPLLDYAIRSNRSSLRTPVCELVLASIASESIKLSRAIRFAEREDNRWWRRVLGWAYYRYALKGPTKWNVDEGLSERHRQRLYAGYCTLVDMRQSLIWEHTCRKESKCSKNLWELIASLGYIGPAADFIGWVAWIQQKLESSHGAITGCQSIGLDAYFNEAKSLRSGRLSELFVDLPW